MRKSRRLEENMNRKNLKKAEKRNKELSPTKMGESDLDLGDLTRDVLVLLLSKRHSWIPLNKILEYFDEDIELKVLTIVFVFEGLGMIKIFDNRRVVFLGVQGAIQQFIAFVLNKVESWKIKIGAKQEKEKTIQKSEVLRWVGK